jgi:hypothetical protein
LLANSGRLNQNAHSASEATSMKRPRLFFCICTLFCAQLLGAQAFAGGGHAEPSGTLPLTPEEQSAQAQSEKDRAMEQVRAELENTERRWYGLIRARYSSSQLLSVGLGAIFVEQPKTEDCAVGCMLHGWQIAVEPGVYGLQASAGWGRLAGETGQLKHLIPTVYYGWAVRGALLRTWGGSRPIEPGHTFAGIEGSFSILRMNFATAVMHSLSSNSPDEWIYCFSMGWGI